MLLNTIITLHRVTLCRNVKDDFTPEGVYYGRVNSALTMNNPIEVFIMVSDYKQKTHTLTKTHYK